MRFWFQNLKKEDREKRLFHFRGSVSTDRRWLFDYSAWSGPSLKFEIVHGCGDETKTAFWFGLLFFTAVIKIPLPKTWYFKRKCIATWDGDKEFWLTDGREYGFYLYQWALFWRWHQRIHESKSGEPWWRYFYFRIDDFFLGRTEYMERDLTDAENIAFRLGGKEFVIDSIKWTDASWFRRRIPIALHEHRQVRLHLKIDKPPMYSGKGENSWDCGDDGTYGVTMEWKHERPSWRNRDEMTKLAAKEYVDGVLKDAKRYGGSSSERGIRSNDAYEYVGRAATA